jgi:hypothetical protein
MSITLDSLISSIKSKKVLSESDFLELDLVNLVKSKPICLCDISIYNSYTGIVSSITRLEDLYSYANKIVRDSFIFIPYEPVEPILEANPSGVIRCSLKDSSICEISTPYDGFGVEVRTDILSICTSPTTVLYKFILPNNKSKLDSNLLSTKEKYGDNISLFMFFSRKAEDSSLKYLMLEYRVSDSSPWRVLSFKTKKDFDLFLKDKPKSPLFEALHKRLSLLAKNMDFSYLRSK